MNCFQLIKSVLDESFSMIEAKDDAHRYKAIEAELTSLSASYAKVIDGHNIDYSKAVTRFAYIYRYTVSHATMVADIIPRAKELKQLFEKKTPVEIACIGGGPGSDFLGIIKHCIDNGLNPPLGLQILDKNPVWSESWSDIRKKIKGTIEVAPSFSTFDVTDPNVWKHYVKHFKADVFTFVYFMSEVYSLKAKANPYFDALFSSAKKGAFFVFLDNRTQGFYDWFDTLAAKNNLQILKSANTEKMLPFSEQCADLGEHFKKLPSPKIKSNVAYRIAVKT